MKEYFLSRTFTIAANSTYLLPFYSRYLALISASQPIQSSDMQVIFDESAGRGDLIPGVCIELPDGEHFSKLLFVNSKAVPVTITVALSEGKIYLNTFTVVGTVPVNLAANTIETPAALAVPAYPTAAVSIAADANQFELLIENTGSKIVWVGDSNVDANAKRGKSINPGDSVIYTLCSAVYLQAESTGASQVSYTRLKRV